MSDFKKDFVTPIGRLVQGSFYEGVDKDQDGKPLVVKTGPNAGQPRTQYFVALAIRKDDPELPAFWAILQDVAAKCFQNGQTQRPDFAWKLVDGDSTIPDMKGVRPCDKTGFAGHYVFKFATGFAPQVYRRNGTSFEQIVERDAVKRGYYVRVSGSVDGNGEQMKPGLYLNMNMALFEAYGEEISSGPDANAAFGGLAATSALPPGASAAPIGGAAVMPAATGLPGSTPVATGLPGSPPPATGLPGSTPVATGLPGSPPPATSLPAATGLPGAPPANVQPAYDFMNPGAPPAEPKYMLSGVAYTAEQLKQSGWNDAQIATLPKA